MQTLAPHVLIALSTFAVTNIDDLLILSIYFAMPNVSVRQIVSGQYLGILLLILLSLTGSFISSFLVPAYISLLGIFPLLLGIKNMYELFKTQSTVNNTKADQSASFISIAFVTFANGGDNIGVYTPLFAKIPLKIILVYLITFLIMTGFWCMLGFYFVKHERVKAIFEKWGRYILPFFLIALGLWIILFS